jgi:hypothetical protein
MSLLPRGQDETIVWEGELSLRAQRPILRQNGDHFLRHGCPRSCLRFPNHGQCDRGGTEIDFFDNSGALTRIQVHVTEETTFSANGTSLTTVPFTYDISVDFDDSGNISEVFTTGIIAKVPLPDGSLFISAGRTDIAACGFPLFILTPTLEVRST